MINIIGAGMAGSIVAKLLRAEGIPFQIYDCKKPSAASQISENLIGLNWYKAQQEMVEKSLSILRSIVPVRKIEAGRNSAWHVYTNDLLEKDFRYSKAVPHGEGIIETPLRVDDGRLIEGDDEFIPGFNIVCAGFWTKAITGIETEGIVGHGFILKGHSLNTELIANYKPFRYEKLIHRTADEVWYSNSLSVSRKTYNENFQRYYEELLEGAQRFTKLDINQMIKKGTCEYRTGIRPMAATHENIRIPNGLVITGGYKSGMLYYPIQAVQAVDYIKQNVKWN